jgi:hypothetical protein
MTDTRATAEAHTAFFSIAEADGDVTFNGLSQDSVYVWGAQATATAYPVSYIKTEGATVTRLADIIRYDPVSILSRGAIAVDCLPNASTSGTDGLAALSDGGASNFVRSYFSSLSPVTYVLNGGVNVALIVGAGKIAGVWAEIRTLFATDDVRLLKDGVATGSPDTSAAMPAGLDRLDIGNVPDYADGLVRVRLFNKPTMKNVTEFK